MMKKVNFKRLGSLVMACALMIASVGDGAFSLPVEAAVGDLSTVKLTYVDDSLYTNCITNDSVGIKLVVPDNKKVNIEKIQVTPPTTGSEDDIELDRNALRLSVKSGAKSGDYTVSAKLYATKSTGVLEENYITKEKDPITGSETEVQHRSAGTFELQNYADNISTDSSISFKCVTGQAESVSPSFGEPTLQAGYFAGYTKVAFVSGSYKEVEGRAQIQVMLSGTGKTDIIVTFTSDQKHISKDSEYVFRFQPEITNSIGLTVLNPGEMADKIVQEIAGDTTWPNFITIRNEGDTLQSLTEGYIDLLRVYNKYPDYKFTITWEIDDSLQTVMKIHGDQESGNTTTIYITPLDDQVSGKLKPTVTYYPTVGDPIPSTLQADVNLKVLGKGEPPKIATTVQYISGATSHPFPNDTIPAKLEMDFYDGQVPAFPKNTGQPYLIEGNFTSGTKSKQCEYLTITSTDPEAVSLEYETQSGEMAIYDLTKETPDKIEMKNDDPNVNKSVFYKISANETKADTMLTFTYYRNGIAQTPKITTRINVQDTSPNRDTTLSDVTMKTYTGKPFDLGTKYELKFSPIIRDYPVPLGYRTEKVRFTAFKNENKQRITMSVDGGPPVPIENGVSGQEIELMYNVEKKVVFTVTAESEDSNDYTFLLMRKPPSDVPTLQTIKLLETDEEAAKEIPITPTFAEKTFIYRATVPYKTEQVLVEVASTDSGASVVSIEPNAIGEKDPTALRQWVPLVYEVDDAGKMTSDTTPIQVVMQAEDGKESATYTINVKRGAPDRDASLGKLEVADVDDKVLAYKPGLAATVMEYELKIPYTTKEVKFKASAKAANAKVALMQGTKMLIPTMSADIFTKAFQVNTTSEAAPSYDFNFAVTAEDGVTLKTYTLKIIREAPNNEAALSAIGLADDKGGALAVEGFDPENKTYAIEVPYSVEGVVVTPTPKNPKSIVRVAGKVADKEGKFPVIKLSYPGETIIDIVVTAEDGVTTATYTLTIKRSKPGTDSRLKTLVAAKIVDDKLKPLFVPDTLKYTATMVAEEKGVTITATANDPKAKITIDGKPAESGKPFGPIELLAVQQTVEIVIIAEDGKSTTTYTITFTNDNLVIKSPNADLKSLKVQKGEMKPSFKASTTTYEVYVTEDSFDVDLFPVPADSLAKMEVFAGTLKIGDYGGNYSQSIADGENPFSIKVTSPDGKVTKDYLVNVYRNEEDKMGSLKPLMIDDVNFEESGDIISVDVTKWPRIASEVFEELKNYPEKKMVFQGNDYSLQFDAKDLNTIIPATAIYDFGMDFTSDFEDAIMTEINSYSGNSESRPVLVDFNYHGELPGKATFTLSLGKQYANKKLYFHYYNEERGRIDYYGYVQTNSKGTFSVSLDRLGTFIITDDKRLIGSENKALLDTQAEGIDLGKTEDVIQNKVNPNTGVTQVPPPPIG